MTEPHSKSEAKRRAVQDEGQNQILYKGPFWIFIGKSGMPTAVQKCMFKPTILPSVGDWYEAHLGLESELIAAQAEIERLKEFEWKYEEIVK